MQFFNSLSEDTVKTFSNRNQDPGWLREYRLKSFNFFKELPFEKSELFKKYVDLIGIQNNFEIINVPNGKKIPDELKFLSNSSEFSVNQVNSEIVEIKIPNELKKKGVILIDMKTALTEHEDLIKKYIINRILQPNEDKFVAMNNSFFNSGFFLHIPNNFHIETPFEFKLFLSGENSAIFSQNIIDVGKNSSFIYVEESYSSSGLENQTLFSNVTEINLKEDSEMKIGKVQSFGNNVISFFNTRAVLDNNSKINWSSGFFGGAFTLSKLDNVMKGNGSEAHDFELVFGNERQKFDITSNLTHVGESTNGRVIAKGVFKDFSKSIFKGMINIGKHAKNSNSYLSEHSILLSKDARSDAIPGLEIENNNVKATHSASVAQINQDQIFYLMARGLSEDEAKKLIILGFYDPLIRQIPLSDVKIRIKGLTELKWNNEPLSNLNKVSERIEEEEKVEQVSRDIFEGHYKYR